MRVRDLKKVKNQVLCELEDYLLDAIIDHMEGIQSNDPEVSSTSLMKVAKDISLVIKKNAKAVALICYINDDGSNVTEDDLKDLPLKLKVFTECFNPIMEIVMEFMSGEADSSGDGSGKPPRVTSSRS
jgi:DNA-binding protein Fis